MDELIPRKGGTTPGAFPHSCPYSPIGADEVTCSGYTGNFPRNMGACVASKCNSRLRKCFACVEAGRGKAAGKVDDPIVGLCTEHAGAVKAPVAIPPGVRLRQPVFAPRASRPRIIEQSDTDRKRLAQRFTESRTPAPPASIPQRRTEVAALRAAGGTEPIPTTERTIVKEDAVPTSTAEQFELLRLLNADEMFVLKKSAYGLDVGDIDPLLKRLDNRATSMSAMDLFRAIYRKLNVEGHEKERDRLRAAGKIFLDAREDEIERATPGIYTGVAVVATMVGDTASFASPQSADDDEETNAEDATEIAQPTRTEKPMSNSDVSGALKVSCQWVEANSDESKPRPNIKAVYDAVEAMLGSGMKAREVGLEFGNTEASGPAWVSVVRSFRNFNASIWRLIGDHPIAMSALKDASTKDDVAEQRDRIQAWIDKHAKKEEKTPSATKPRHANGAATTPTKAGRREAAEMAASNGEKNGSTAVVVTNGHDVASTIGFSLPTLSDNPAPSEIFDFTVGVLQGVDQLQRIAHLLGQAAGSAESLDLHQAAAARMVGGQIDTAMAHMQRVRDMFVQD